MSKKQTRRSVSIRGSTYDTVREHCERHGMSMSEFVEERIAGFFGTQFTKDVKGTKEVAASAPRPVQTPPRTAMRKMARLRSVGKLTSKQLQDAARFFTF